MMNKKDRLIIIGANGQGKVVAEIAKKMNVWTSIAFLDDDPSKIKVLDYEVIGRSTDALEYIEDSDFFVAVGDNYVREEIFNALESSGIRLPKLIHPTAVISEHAEIGSGTVIMAGVIINSCVKIGKGCIINSGSIIEHDTEIDDFVHISPGSRLAGSVKVGRGSWIGAGCTVINQIHITQNCTVGAGATVITNITEEGTYVGVPARRISK